MDCGKPAKLTFIPDTKKVFINHVADRIAAPRKCGNRLGRFGFVCEDCARDKGWIW
jgi:hypothetical protein